MTEIETFTEWRVTGEPGWIQPPSWLASLPGCDVPAHRYRAYDFTWSPHAGPVEHRRDPEAAARAFVAGITKPGRAPWEDGPHLWSRTVSRTPWERADTP